MELTPFTYKKTPEKEPETIEIGRLRNKKIIEMLSSLEIEAPVLLDIPACRDAQQRAQKLKSYRNCVYRFGKLNNKSFGIIYNSGEYYIIRYN